MAAAAAAAPPEQVKSDIRRGWWLWLLWGICAIVLGMAIFAQPLVTGLVLTTFIGAYWLVSGIIDVIMAIIRRQGPWGWFIFTGIISILAGGMLMVHPILGLWTLVSLFYYIIAFAAIFTGVIRMFAGWKNSSGIGYRWTWGSLIVGLLLCIFGILMLLNPEGKVIAITYTAGIVAISAGVFSCIFAFMVRSAK
jgi:uncharacterized membrane protein HdeD (DUF308 family)